MVLERIANPSSGESRFLSSSLSRTAKLSVNAETVDSPTAVGVKGSSPLEVCKTFSMVLLEVRILLHTPSLCSKVGLGHSVVK